MGVDRLGEGTEFGEGVRFADAGDLILDSGWKSAIQLSAEGNVTPLDTSSEVVEVNEVLHDVLVVMACGESQGQPLLHPQGHVVQSCSSALQ